MLHQPNEILGTYTLPDGLTACQMEFNALAGMGNVTSQACCLLSRQPPGSLCPFALLVPTIMTVAMSCS